MSGELDGMAYAYPHSLATAQITFSDTLTTDGPVRTGIVTEIFEPMICRYRGVVSTVCLACTSASDIRTSGSNYDLRTWPAVYVHNRRKCVNKLGRRNSLDSPVLDAFDLAFFEADEVTPVALTEVTLAPEPASLALTLIGIAGAIVGRSRLRLNDPYDLAG